MSEYIKNNFLPADQERASKELDCYNHCIMQAIEHVANDRLDKAAAYHENGARSLKVLAELRKNHDKAWLINKQIKADSESRKIIERCIDAYG